MAPHNSPDAKDYYPPPLGEAPSEYSRIGPFAGLQATTDVLHALKSPSRRTRRMAWLLILARPLVGFGLFGAISLWAMWS